MYCTTNGKIRVGFVVDAFQDRVSLFNSPGALLEFTLDQALPELRDPLASAS